MPRERMEQHIKRWLPTARMREFAFMLSILLLLRRDGSRRETARPGPRL